MSGVALTIDVRDQITPALRKLQGGLAPGVLAKLVGQAGVNLFKAHFAALNSARANRLGGPRTNFYAGAARATSHQPSPGGVTIAVNQQGIAQRYFGGEIKPRTARFLAIPANASAYGTRPRESRWNGKLAFALVGGRHPALVARDNLNLGKQRGQRGAGEVLFWLARSVTQRPDPSVIPTEAAIQGAVGSAVRNHVAALTDRRNS